MLGMHALQFNALPDFDAITPLDATDEACLEEIREVLVKHDRISRFGICLLHRHFSVSDDELLVERTDTENRQLIAQPVKTADLIGTTLVETLWRFDGKAGQACEKYCPTRDGRHDGFKDHR